MLFFWYSGNKLEIIFVESRENVSSLHDCCDEQRDDDNRLFPLSKIIINLSLFKTLDSVYKRGVRCLQMILLLNFPNCYGLRNLLFRIFLLYIDCSLLCVGALFKLLEQSASSYIIWPRFSPATWFFVQDIPRYAQSKEKLEGFISMLEMLGNSVSNALVVSCESWRLSS